MKQSENFKYDRFFAKDLLNQGEAYTSEVEQTSIVRPYKDLLL